MFRDNLQERLRMMEIRKHSENTHKQDFLKALSDRLYFTSRYLFQSVKRVPPKIIYVPKDLVIGIGGGSQVEFNINMMLMSLAGHRIYRTLDGTYCATLYRTYDEFGLNS